MTPTWNFTIALGAALLALAACSDDKPTNVASNATGNGVCLHADQIDHTEILTDSAIVFYLKGSKPLLNTMRFPCPSLKMEDGFAFTTDFPEICSNAQTIRVVRSGNFCELGQFTPFDPSKAPNQSTPTKS